MITDADILTIGLLLFAEMILFSLGVKKAAAFGILSGLFGFFLAIEIWNVLGDAIAAAAWGVVAIALSLVAIAGIE